MSRTPGFLQGLSRPSLVGGLLLALCNCQPADPVELAEQSRDAQMSMADVGRATALDTGVHDQNAPLQDAEPPLDSSTCLQDDGACTPPMNDCQNTGDCAAGETCMNGQCTESSNDCLSALDCGDSDTCYQGTCEPLRPALCGEQPVCEGRSQCGSVSGCTPEPSCLGTYGASCMSQCDCSGQLICQNSTNQCRECLHGGQCNIDGQVCTSGGLCAPIRPIPLPATDETVRALINALSECVSSSIAGRTTIGCAQLVSSGPSGDEHVLNPEILDSLCSHPDVQDDPSNQLSELLGCSGERSHVLWTQALIPEESILGCMAYLPYLPQSSGESSDWRIYVGPCSDMVSAEINP